MPISIKHLVKPGSQYVISYYAKWTDGLYYTAKVLECKQEARKALLKFEDDTQHWMDFDLIHADLDMKHLSDSLIVCCICDGDKSEEPDLMLICDQCQQAYHMNCHKPKIDRESAKPEDHDVPWNCAACIEFLKQKPAQVKKINVATPKRKKPNPQVSKTSVKKDKKTNVRIKLDRRASVSEERTEPNTEAIKDDDLIELTKPNYKQDAGRVEKMSQSVIKVAKTLATVDSAEIMESDKFVKLIRAEIVDDTIITNNPTANLAPKTALNNNEARPKPESKRKAARKIVKEPKVETNSKADPRPKVAAAS